MKHFKAKIKEKDKDNILTPEYYGPDNVTSDFLENFWGCNEDDVEWFEIIEVEDNNAK